MSILADITWFQLGEILGALAAGATIGTFIFILATRDRKVVTKVDQEPPPEIRKAAPRYNHALNEQRFGTLEGQVKRDEQRLDKIEDLLRIDLPAMERRLATASEKRISDMHDRINEILCAVGELRGEMKAKTRNCENKS